MKCASRMKNEARLTAHEACLWHIAEKSVYRHFYLIKKTKTLIGVFLPVCTVRCAS